jgi:hypothetical protein
MQVWEIRKAVLGVEHPSTVTRMANMITIYIGQARWDKDEELGLEAVVMSMMGLGAEHPHTLITMNNLAYI